MSDTPTIDAERVVLTGRKLAGKDHVAENNGYTIYGFADPMYKIAESFIGSSDKSVPGVRTFLRKVGAWGRGEVSEEYPLTFERHIATANVREDGPWMTGMGMDSTWEQFGRTDEFWIDLLLSRLEDADEQKIAVTNARFPNEVNRLTEEAGFLHLHVSCSPRTRAERHDRTGEPMDEDVPLTERLAAEFDWKAGVDDDVDPPLEMTADVDPTLLKEVKARRSVVWNDPKRTIPPRYQPAHA